MSWMSERLNSPLFFLFSLELPRLVYVSENLGERSEPHRQCYRKF